MIDFLVKGQRVRVHPHGSPDQAAAGVVELISSNQRSVAVLFDEMPLFAFQRAMPLVGVHPDGIAMLAYREEVGPWIELAGGGHYEIEVEEQKQ